MKFNFILLQAPKFFQKHQIQKKNPPWNVYVEKEIKYFYEVAAKHCPFVCIKKKVCFSNSKEKGKKMQSGILV